MRKLFVVLLIGSLLLVSVPVMAENAVNPASDYTKIKAYTIYNPDNTDYEGKLVDSTVITTDDKIVGISLTCTNNIHNAGISLWDVTSLANASELLAEPIVEAEAKMGENSLSLWLPYPYKVTNQLVIRGGDTGFVLTIWYIDVSDPN